MTSTKTCDAVAHAAQPLAVSGGDDELKRLATSEALALTPDELRTIRERLGRDPTRAEAHAFAIQWSEHCSYKSSRALLARLPTQGLDVVVPVGEDAGALALGAIDGVEFCAVIAHESHNHPAQVVPFEGAATGVGGILRDVLCMGAKVVACADPLRFGPPHAGSHQAYVARAAVEGIAAYGNAVGVPNLAGDVYFHPSYAENCLVNVVAVGIVERARILPSRVPPGAEGYDLVLVGKATDASGFGGAAFASLALDAGHADVNKSAVQVPDPFLENVIMRASYAAFDEIHARGIQVGFKDLGAGGILGSSAELCAAGGFGADIDLDAVPLAVAGLSPIVVALAETQERMLWAVPPSFTPRLLELYNEVFTLPSVSANARAAVIGKVTRERRYVVRSGGRTVCDVPIDTLTQAPVRRLALAPPPPAPAPYATPELRDPGGVLLQVLAHADVCSRRPLVEHYDTVVRGATAIPAGYADAGVVLVRRGARLALALAVDGNPRYAALDARLGAAHAVVEAARNVAAVGAWPIGLTDCLNYGNPEDPAVYRALADGIEGLAEAARAVTVSSPLGLPFVSGNVSLYNQSASGASVVPSAIVACLGRIDDVGRTVGMHVHTAGEVLYFVGSFPESLGGSVVAEVCAVPQPGPVPALNYPQVNAGIVTVVQGIRAGIVSAAHDVSDGGLLACVAEMCLGHQGGPMMGAQVAAPTRWAPDVDLPRALFGESGGFVVAVPADATSAFENLAAATGADVHRLGMTGGEALSVDDVCSVDLARLAAAWRSPLEELYS